MIPSTDKMGISTGIVPDSPNKPYDIKQLIEGVVDHGSFFEVQCRFAQNIVVGFGRLGGNAVGIVAEPTLGTCRLPRHQRFGESGKVRSFLR